MDWISHVKTLKENPNLTTLKDVVRVANNNSTEYNGKFFKNKKHKLSKKEENLENNCNISNLLSADHQR